MKYQISQSLWSKIGIGLAIFLSLETTVSSAETQSVIARLDLTPIPTQQNPRPDSSPTLKIGNLKTYRHPNSLFSIDIPQKWQLENSSKPQHVRMQWQDRDRDGLICIELLYSSRQFTEEELGAELTQVLKRVYAPYPRLSIKVPVTQPNGSVRVAWSYQKKASDGSIKSYAGNSFMQQYGNKLSASYYVLPVQQYAQLKEPLNQIISSYQVSDAAEIP
jgi:hypothetical protein